MKYVATMSTYWLLKEMTNTEYLTQNMEKLSRAYMKDGIDIDGMDIDGMDYTNTKPIFKFNVMKYFWTFLCIAGVIIWIFVNNNSGGTNQDYQYENSYSSQPTEAKSVDMELQRVLKRIAGTYEMYEPRGMEGIHIIYTVKINTDGTGVVAYNTGEREYFTGAYLQDNKTIVFTNDYGGTPFTIFGNEIEDPACRKYYNEVGAYRYYMRKVQQNNW